jgi:asparagine synthase (glutamine-hydrolysing)
MLNALISIQDADPDGVERARTSMAAQGFAPAATLRWSQGAIEGWTRAGAATGDLDNAILDSPAGRACVVGPMWYRTEFGRAACQRVLGDHAAGSTIDERDLRGSFALFVQSDHGALLINDPLGLVKIHSSSDGRFRSTSWLATRAYGGAREIDEMAAIEYVLLGASHSQRSVATGVSHLALGQGFDLARRRTFSRFEDGVGEGGQRFARLDDAVAAFAAHLREVSAEVARAFANRVTCALSGGFDSRLIVAGLLASGTRPHLFVYGSQGSSDVRIASNVAGSERLALDVIDKDVLERARREPDVADVVANALFFDGLPNDGILDSGVDRDTRLRQCADGAIALNGGGGEILRNFFHLPDRPFTARDVVRTFYRGFDTGVFRQASGLRDYEDSLAGSIDASISAAGSPAAHRDGRYSREQIELVYPLFRCHHWMGVNNSVAVRYGQFATPLVDLTLVRDACLLPLRWKNAGRFEARLIAALHPAIASAPSAYGFRFDRGPGFRARASEWATLCRPVFARPWIGAARRALQGARVPRTLIERWRSVFPGEWRLDDVLDLERLPDRSSFARALAVEVVSRELGP